MTRVATVLGFVLALYATGGLKASGYPVAAQRPEVLPASLQSMVNTERAFAARARVVGWKQSFLEYFADAAIGFDGEQAGSANEQIRTQPDPPKDLQLLWEPRYGDVAASGELGNTWGSYAVPAAGAEPAQTGFYTRVWTRGRDGAWKVALDVLQPQ